MKPPALSQIGSTGTPEKQKSPALPRNGNRRHPRQNKNRRHFIKGIAGTPGKATATPVKQQRAEPLWARLSFLLNLFSFSAALDKCPNHKHQHQQDHDREQNPQGKPHDHSQRFRVIFIIDIINRQARIQIRRACGVDRQQIKNHRAADLPPASGATPRAQPDRGIFSLTPRMFSCCAECSP